jgi:ABC-2 type transport system permease protein
MQQLHALGKLIRVQTKLYLREPVAVFFTLLFAPLYLIMNWLIAGNQPLAELGGRGSLEAYLPACAAIVIAVVGLMPGAIETANRREAGVLRRFRATPLRPLTYIIGDVGVYLAMILLGILFVMLLAYFAFGVRSVGNVPSMFAAILLSATSFLAVGYVLASVLPNARAVTVVGNVLLFPMIAFSGATVPLEIMPETVRTIAKFVPLTHVITLLRGAWFGEPWSALLTEVAVLVGLLVVGTVVSALTFRWE